MKMLVISLGGAGDTLMATPLLRELKRAFPDAAVDVLTMQGDVARDILAGNPCVQGMLHHNFMTASPVASLRFCNQLRKRRYDISFTLMPQNRFEYNLITWLIGARRRVGFEFDIACGALPSLFLTHLVKELPQAHLVENNLRLLAEGLRVPLSGTEHPLELHPEPEHLRQAEQFQVALPRDRQAWIGMHPGSGTTKNLAMRRWPPASWAELIRQLAGERDMGVILFGSPAEHELRQEIRRRAGVADDLLIDAPKGTILETAALVSRMNVFVCCDTLLTHIAAAMQVPTVVIMGPTPHTSVYPWQCPHEIVRTDIFCSPCYGYSRMGIRCTHPVHFACLKAVTADMVRSAITAALIP